MIMGCSKKLRGRAFQGFILLQALFVILSFDLLQAQSIYRSGDVVRITESDTLSLQLIAAGEWIEIAGVLENDLYTAGRQVSVDGSISDDAFIAGESVTINGTIGDMLVTMMQTLVLDGTAGGDVIAAGQTIRFTENAAVGGKLFLAAREVLLEGSMVSGKTRIAAKSAHLNGRFSDHVRIYSNSVTFGPDYYSAGETIIVSSEPVYRDNLGVIPERLTIEVRRAPYLPVLMFQVWFYLSLLLTGTVLLLLFRNIAEDMQRFAVERFWKNTGIGLLLFLLVPFALFLMLFPLITIPLVGVTGILYLLVLFISYLFTAMVLGLQFILWFKKEATTSTFYYALALGLIVIAIMNNLPFLGPLFSLFLLFFGVGTFAAYFYMRYKYPADINEFRKSNTGTGSKEIDNPQ
jgi:hypothetical protein